MIVTVTVNPSLDLTYLLDDGDRVGDPGIEVHRARSATLEASGKGVNVSRVLTRAGRPSPAVLLVGGSTGQQLLDLLTAEQVPHRGVLQRGATRVNTTVLADAGSTTKLNAPGAGPSQAEVDNLVMAVDAELVTQRSQSAGPRSAAAQDWLLICGSMPPGVDAAELIGRLIVTARAHNWRVAVDSSGAGLRAGLEAGADLLAPNAAELADLLGDPAAASAPREAAATLAAGRGCELLVSLGADGALWSDGTHTRQARARAVVPVNSAGAGDALLAGWFADPAEGGAAGADPAERLATAVAWGTAACLAPTTVAIAGPPAVATDAGLVSDFEEVP